MYIKVKCFKPSGKLSQQTTIHPGIPEPNVWDTEKITQMVDKIYPNCDKVVEAYEPFKDQLNTFLIKSTK